MSLIGGFHFLQTSVSSFDANESYVDRLVAKCMGGIKFEVYYIV